MQMFRIGICVVRKKSVGEESVVMQDTVVVGGKHLDNKKVS
jgi:hypothetical protein